MPRQYRAVSFAPFPAAYSSISFSPLVYFPRSVNRVRGLLREHNNLLLQFNHYLALCAFVDQAEALLDNLQENRAEIFTAMATPTFIRLVQPFLIQHHRHQVANRRPISVSSSQNSNNRPPPALQHSPHRPLIDGLDDSVIPILSTPPTPPRRTDTPIPGPSTTRFISPLMTNFQPCPRCGSNTEGHFPGCANQN